MPTNTRRSLVGAAMFATAVASALAVWAFATPRAAATAAQPEENLIGVVDVVQIIEVGLEQPKYTGPRNEFREGWLAALQQLQQQMATLEQQAGLTSPQDPEYQQLFQRYSQIRQQFEQTSADGQRRLEELGVANVRELYLQIRDAIDVVAAREGYRYVLSSRADRDLGDGLTSITAVSQQVLGRPLLYGTSGHDITQLVQTELAFEAPAAPADAPADADVDSADEPADASGQAEPATP